MPTPTAAITLLEPESVDQFAEPVDIDVKADWEVKWGPGNSEYRLTFKLVSENIATQFKVVSRGSSEDFVDDPTVEQTKIHPEPGLHKGATIGFYSVKASSVSEKRKPDGTYEKAVDLGYKTSLYQVGSPNYTAPYGSISDLYPCGETLVIKTPPFPGVATFISGAKFSYGVAGPNDADMWQFKFNIDTTFPDGTVSSVSPTTTALKGGESDVDDDRPCYAGTTSQVGTFTVKAELQVRNFTDTGPWFSLAEKACTFQVTK